MNSIKRAAMRSAYAKGSVILLCFIFTIVLSILIYTKCLINITESAGQKLEETQSGLITLYAEKDTFEIGLTGKTFSQDFVRQLESKEGIRLLYYSGNLPAYGCDLKIYRSDESNKKIYEATVEGYDFETANDTTLVGVSELKEYPDFKNQSYVITEGRTIDEQDGNEKVAVVSDILAMNNDIALGDTVTYKVGSKDGKEINLKVVGFHSDQDDMNGSTLGYAGSSSQENLVFIPEKLAAELSGGSYLTQIEIELAQAGKSESVIQWMTQLEPQVMKSATILNRNYEYLEKSAIISAQTNYYKVVLWAGYGTAIAVLGLFVAYLTIGRKKEFGILRSMGVTTVNILLQILAELLIPLIISIPLAIKISQIILQKISLPGLILQYASQMQMLGSRDIIYILVMEMIMLTFAVIIISVTIFIKSPKELLRGRGA